MKIVLTLFLCSFNTNVCYPPYEYPKTFNNYYDCLNTGYNEAIKKSEQLGRDSVNKNGYYIRFICSEKKQKGILS